MYKIKSFKFAFTLTKGGKGWTQSTSTTEHPLKPNGNRHVIASECEAIQPIKDVNHHGVAGTDKCNELNVLTSYRLNVFTRCAAFTLAEVLITLAVIGIVAALTIPSLMQRYVNRMTETRLAKFYSMINQAILLSKIDNGEPETWDYWVSDKKDEDGNLINQNDATDKAFQRYLAPYLKIVSKKEVTDGDGKKRILYYFADGSAFAFSEHEIRDWAFFPHQADKCIKLKAKLSSGICMFSFTFYPANISMSSSLDWAWKYHIGKGLEPHLHKWNGDIETLYNDEERGCAIASSVGAYCTAIIARNGWKIPDDYPRKIQY